MVGKGIEGTPPGQLALQYPVMTAGVDERPHVFEGNVGKLDGIYEGATVGKVGIDDTVGLAVVGDTEGSTEVGTWVGLILYPQHSVGAGVIQLFSG